MSNSSRRQFVIRFMALGAAIPSLDAVAQGAGPRLSEADPQALALGYKDDTSKVDAAKFPKHAAAQTCGSCQLFQGKVTDATGGCPLFSGKQVAGPGWCSAWNKRAA